MTYPPQPSDPNETAYLPAGYNATGQPGGYRPSGYDTSGFNVTGYESVPPAPLDNQVFQYGFAAPRPVRSAGIAMLLELLPGLIGVFGVGNIYAGRTGTGIALMISFWVLFWINMALMLVLIGLVTLPLTWAAYLVAGPVLAARAVESFNSGQ